MNQKFVTAKLLFGLKNYLTTLGYLRTSYYLFHIFEKRE